MGLPVFLLNFSGLRQAIAMGITALSFNFIKEKKPVQFILLVILASLFHKSAIVFLAMYPIYNIKLDKFGKVMSIVVLGIVYFARVNIFNLAMSILGYAIVPDMNGSIMLFIFYTMIYILAMLWKHLVIKLKLVLEIYFMWLAYVKYSLMYTRLRGDLDFITLSM